MSSNSLLTLVQIMRNRGGAVMSSTLLNAHNFLTSIGYGGAATLLSVRDRTAAWENDLNNVGGGGGK
jgi:hypothetical protein